MTESAAANLIDAKVANAPRQSGNLWTRYNVPEGVFHGFGIGLGIVYTGERNAVVDNRFPQMLTIPSNTRYDVSLYYRWNRVDFAIKVNNAADHSYIVGGDAPTAPNQVVSQTTAKFSDTTGQ